MSFRLQCPSSLDSCNDSHISHSFFVQEYVLLVLRPEHLFPNNPLLNHRNALRVTRSEIFVGFLLFPAEILLCGLTQSLIPRIRFGYLCRPEDSLSVFSLLFRGNSKLQNTEKGSNSPLLAICAECCRHRFHAPGKVQNPAPSPFLPGPPPPSTTLSVPTSSTKPHGEGRSHWGQGPKYPLGTW